VAVQDLTNRMILTIIQTIMAPQQRFDLVYAPQVKEHLKAIERKYYGLIRREIEMQLRFEPDTETRNRKPLGRPVSFEAEWEVRCGPGNRLRIFYEVHREAGEVHILAIGVKQRNKLIVGREEFEL